MERARAENLAPLTRARQIALRWRATIAERVVRLAPTEAQRLLLLTMAIGIVCGLVAVAFHEVIRHSVETFEELTRDTPLWPLIMITVPAGGALIAGIFVTAFFPDARGSGVPQVKACFAGRRGRLRLRDALVKFPLAALQIGSGASLGREGPTVQICAGVAAALGRFARVSPRAQRSLIPVGAAAGVAAAFNAPIAAVTFTIEEIIGKLDATLLAGVILAAALAAVTERSILGRHPVFELPVRPGVDDWRSLLLYAVLGIAAAVAAIAFLDLLLGLRRWFKSAHRIPEWLRPAIGAAATGLVAALAMMLVHTTGITGGGYATLRRALLGDLRIEVLIVLCVAKLLATCFSYSSGGVGGIFAPVLFIGAMLGGAVGALDVRLFGHPEQTAAAFALVGMGAMFSAAIKAPMTSVLIIVEMTSGYELILPLMIANMTAYLIVRRVRPQPIYEALLAQDGIRLDEGQFGEGIEQTTLKELVEWNRPFVTFALNDRAEEILRVTRAPTWQTVFPVIRRDGCIEGIITSVELRELLAEPELLHIANAADLMRPPVTVTTDDSLRHALERMHREGLRELPVIDDERRVTGFVDEGVLAHLYLASLPAAPVSTRD